MLDNPDFIGYPIDAYLPPNDSLLLYERSKVEFRNIREILGLPPLGEEKLFNPFISKPISVVDENYPLLQTDRPMIMRSASQSLIDETVKNEFQELPFANLNSL